MFSRLFAESGLSLDRLRSLVEVGACGGIARAAGSDPVRQSLYSRQLKELEDFFQTGLVERHGKGIRLTPAGRELARISRFFLMGLSNFQRGCLAEGQTYRLAASPTFIQAFLLPVLAAQRAAEPSIRFKVEGAGEDEIERRLHDLTLDFGIVTRSALSRPLQSRDLGAWRLSVWVPKALARSERLALGALKARRLPLAWATGELPPERFPALEDYEPALSCHDFLEARSLLETGTMAAFLPDFLPPASPQRYFKLEGTNFGPAEFHFALAWNPRLLRLNPHASRRRDALAESLARKLVRR